MRLLLLYLSGSVVAADLLLSRGVRRWRDPAWWFAVGLWPVMLVARWRDVWLRRWVPVVWLLFVAAILLIPAAGTDPETAVEVETVTDTIGSRAAPDHPEWEPLPDVEEWTPGDAERLAYWLSVFETTGRPPLSEADGWCDALASGHDLAGTFATVGVSDADLVELTLAVRSACPERYWEVRREIRVWAESPLYGIQDVADAIGWCESRDDYSAENPESSASGRYQFLDATWLWTFETLIGEDAPEGRAMDASRYDQDRAFASLYRHDGLGPWEPSRHCWEPMLFDGFDVDDEGV